MRRIVRREVSTMLKRNKWGEYVRVREPEEEEELSPADSPKFCESCGRMIWRGDRLEKEDFDGNYFCKRCDRGGDDE